MTRSPIAVEADMIGHPPLCLRHDADGVLRRCAYQGLTIEHEGRALTGCWVPLDDDVRGWPGPLVYLALGADGQWPAGLSVRDIEAAVRAMQADA